MSYVYDYDKPSLSCILDFIQVKHTGSIPSPYVLKKSGTKIATLKVGEKIEKNLNFL